MNTRHTVQRNKFVKQWFSLVKKQENVVGIRKRVDTFIELYTFIDNNFEFIVQNAKDFAAICLIIYKKTKEIYDTIPSFTTKNNSEHMKHASEVVCKVHEKMGKYIVTHKKQWSWDKTLCANAERLIPNFQTSVKEFTYVPLDASTLE